MTTIDFLKPIRVFGYFFLSVGCISVITHFLSLSETNYTYGFRVFVLSVGLFHFLIGLGILLRKRWGFYGFKCYLYLLYIAVPIGTYIAVRTLEYLRRYDIKQSFN